MKTSGWDFIAIILDNKLVFRFPRHKGEYGPKDLAQEAEFLKHMKKKLPLPIPQYNYIAKNAAFVGYDIVPGREFSIYQYRRLNPAQKQKAARDLAEFLSALHGIPLNRIKKFNLKKHNDLQEFNVTKRALPKKELPKVKKYLSLWEAIVKEKTPQALIHADIFSEHIIINHKKISGIIDFTDRTIFDPAEDFTGLWYFGPKFVNLVYQHYQGPKDDNFLYRAKIYNIRSYLWLLIDYHQGKRQEWYKKNPQFEKKVKQALKYLD